MALVIPVGCAGLSASLPAYVRHRRRATSIATTTFATLSPLRCGEAAVDWAEATSSFFEKDTRPIMNIRFEALQSEAGKKLLRRSGRAPDDISSVVLVEKQRSYIKSEAVLKIMEYIDLPFPQLAIFLHFVPLFIRDFVYDNVANNRYTFFGRSDSCEI
ncbi:hypothetical protein TEA_001272 [Camellia sinensis var. sinensis]|uniref:DCC family protein n=1 Tax=Camellia sinensis var. sinensis TaxID=542762 RepID=A0A4S4ED36_CAMSN|nr:hypothetical protein TEA_001272 [Camellia sinensis var. sinensis]